MDAFNKSIRFKLKCLYSPNSIAYPSTHSPTSINTETILNNRFY